MYRKIITNDIKRSPAVTLITTLFIATAATLAALAGSLAVELGGAIDGLMERSLTPHFMQMHAGRVDEERLAAFARSRADVVAYRAGAFLNVDGSRFRFASGSLADSGQDNGLWTQGDGFDYLVGLDGAVVRPVAGELYAPVCYMQDGTARRGERATVAGREFVVAGFVRDSQMNSRLASSKRFVVCDEDFAALAPEGTIEYLIAFRLADPSRQGEFESAYAAAGLEANGPTLSYALFRMMSAVSDGLMIALLFLVAGLVVVIAFLCVRFTLLAKIEDEYREIGVLKAIGIRVADIRKLYLAKYAAVSTIACVLGYVASLFLREPLLAGIRLNFGEARDATTGETLAAAGAVLVFLSVIGYVTGVLRRFKRVSAAEAIRAGSSGDGAGATRRRSSLGGLAGVNAALAVQDVRVRPRLYATMLAVFALAAFMAIVPGNLYSTISSASFCRYLGIGQSDLRVDVQQVEDPGATAAELAARRADDADIAAYAVMTTRAYAARVAGGATERLKVELGDHGAFPVAYAEGRAPASTEDIALSLIQARELGKGVGDELVLESGADARTLRVCGVYSDVTNGGKTAKAAFSDDSGGAMWAVVNASLTPGADPALTGARYAAAFPGLKVSDLASHVRRTFGQTMDAVGRAAAVSAIAALGLSGLVTLLFMRLLVAKDRYAIAVLKAIGFSDRDLAVQYLTRALLVSLLGAALGAVLAGSAGQSLTGAVMAGFGAASFEFVIDPWRSYLAIPLALVATVSAAALVRAPLAGRVSIPETIKE